MPSQIECAVVRPKGQMDMVMLTLERRAGRAPAVVKPGGDAITLVGSDGVEETLILNGEQGQVDLKDLQRAAQDGGILVCEFNAEEEEASPTHWLAERAR